MKQVVEIRQGMIHLFFYEPPSDPPPMSLDDLRKALARQTRNAPPKVARLAGWALDHPQEMAFHSVRALAKRADVNANTVFRLAVALGFAGYDPCRRAFQAALRDRGGMYGSRAQQLRSAADGDGLTERIRDSAHANVDALFDSENRDRIGQAVDMLMAARRIHTVGVRSCFSLAHYLAYTGRMAFDSFAPPLNEPGGIADAITETGPEDVVIPITFSLYSAEVVRAHETARARRRENHRDHRQLCLAAGAGGGSCLLPADGGAANAALARGGLRAGRGAGRPHDRAVRPRGKAHRGLRGTDAGVWRLRAGRGAALIRPRACRSRGRRHVPPRQRTASAR